MEQLNLNKILNREESEEKLKEILNLFEKNKHLMVFTFMEVLDQVKLILLKKF